MTDYPECACPSLDQITRLGLEGRPVPTCPIHRPEPSQQRPALALNSDELTQALGEPLSF